MKRRSKVELFERIRRAYEFEKKSIRAIARQYGVHRRTVRQAIANAIPPDRKTPQRPQPQMDEVKEFIKQILEKDKKEPRKQHHTAHRIFVRIGREMSGIKVSERTVRKYVQQQKLTLGLDGRDVMIVKATSTEKKPRSIGTKRSPKSMGSGVHCSSSQCGVWPAERPITGLMIGRRSRHFWKRIRWRSITLTGSSGV